MAQNVKLEISFDETCLTLKPITITFNNPQEAFIYLSLKQNELYKQGFAASYIDTTYADSIDIKAFFHCNSNYMLKIKYVNLLDKKTVSFSYANKWLYKKHLLNKENINNIHNSIISNFENNGYPFASSKLDSIQFINNTVYSNILVDAGSCIKIDSINIKGELKLIPSCLYTCIGIKPGDAYNQKKIDKMQSRLASLEIATISQTPTILIQESNAFITIHADKKQTGEFDGIIGILPNHYISGKVVVSGDMHIKLNNSFGHAEEINMDWQRQDVATQQLQAKIVYPYILNTPISPDYQLNIYRKDSSYITSTNTFSLQYRFNGKNYFKSFIELSQTSIIKKLSNTNTSLNPYYNTSTNMYGTELFLKQVNNLVTPTKGYEVQFIIGAGTKKINADSILINNKYIIPKKSTSQYKATIFLKYYFPIYKRNIVYLANNSNWIYNEYLSIHDFTRIGGLKTLRGFDEESFKLATYSINTIEYRYMLEKNSYLTTFIDQAFFVKTPTSNIQHKQATGIGVGSVFETKAGIFSLYYAIGMQPKEPIQFRNAKIHFGYINRF